MTLHLFVNPLVVWIWIGGAIVGDRLHLRHLARAPPRQVPATQPQRAPSVSPVEGA